MKNTAKELKNQSVEDVVEANGEMPDELVALTDDLLAQMQGDSTDVYATAGASVLMPLQVRRSTATEYFRIHPKGIYHCALIEMPGDREPFLAFGTVMVMLGQAIAKPTTLARAVNQSGAEFFLQAPRTEVGPKVIDMAVAAWTLVQWDKSAGTHRVSIASDELSTGFGEPRFSNFTSHELFQVTFPEDRRVLTPDHPVAQQFLSRREV